MSKFHEFMIFLKIAFDILIIRYSRSFNEDGSEIRPLDTDQFFITDEDNSFLLQATLNIENADLLPPGVQDQLSISSTAIFNVSGSGTTSLFIEAIGPNRLITTHPQFVNFLRGVTFRTNDQASNLVRNLSVVVEEFPVGEAVRVPAYIPIRVLPINDQPILLSSQITQDLLVNYLPQETQNLGFNASFLLSPNDVMDVDRLSESARDFLGLAVVDVGVVPPSLGVWQYRANEDSPWRDLPANLSRCSPLLADPATRIRFSPSPSVEGESGMTSLTFHSWDGSSVDSLCLTPTAGGKQA